MKEIKEMTDLLLLTILISISAISLNMISIYRKYKGNIPTRIELIQIIIINILFIISITLLIVDYIS